MILRTLDDLQRESDLWRMTMESCVADAEDCQRRVQEGADLCLQQASISATEVREMTGGFSTNSRLAQASLAQTELILKNAEAAQGGAETIHAQTNSCLMQAKVALEAAQASLQQSLDLRKKNSSSQIPGPQELQLTHRVAQLQKIIELADQAARASQTALEVAKSAFTDAHQARLHGTRAVECIQTAELMAEKCREQSERVKEEAQLSRQCADDARQQYRIVTECETSCKTILNGLTQHLDEATQALRILDQPDFAS